MNKDRFLTGLLTFNHEKSFYETSTAPAYGVGRTARSPRSGRGETITKTFRRERIKKAMQKKVVPAQNF